MVDTRKQTVAVRREVDPNDFGALVRHNIEETRILVSKAVVILPPDHGGQEDIQRGNLVPPLNL